MVGVAYMSNATVQIAQNLTVDHAAAAKAVRLPRGTVSAMDSPYLSLISLVKSWPQQKVRRQVLMVSDGIDRLRGESTSPSPFPTPGRPGRTLAPAPGTMPTISSDADTASNARSEEHTSELQSLTNLVCRLLLDPASTEIYTLSLHDALPI